MRVKSVLAALAVTMMAGSVPSTTALAQAKWDLPAGYPAGNFHTKNLVAFAADVKKLSGGKLEITVHPGASLFKVPEIKRAVQTGQAQIGELLMSNLQNEMPIFGIDTVPFLADSYDEAMKLYKASKPIVEKKLADQGMTLLYTVPWPAQGIYANKELKTIDDMKGLKFRVYNPATARIGELVGAQPVTIQAAELAQALATNTVNSFITSPSTGRDSKVWESLKYFYDAQAWLPKDMVFVNNAALNKLDAASKKALMDAAAAAEKRGWDMSKAEAEDAKAALVEGGMTVAPPSAELAAGFKKIGATLEAEWLKSAGTDGATAIKAYKAM